MHLFPPGLGTMSYLRGQEKRRSQPQTGAYHLYQRQARSPLCPSCPVHPHSSLAQKADLPIYLLPALLLQSWWGAHYPTPQDRLCR